MIQNFPTRQVHLDFHTSPHIKDVGKDFDPKTFARTVKKANVNSVTVFGKCHHGYSYYPTKIGTVHPGLVRKNLLLDQVVALHKEGIRAPIYFTIQWDALTAGKHADWLCTNAKGDLYTFGEPPSYFAWKFVSILSPAMDEMRAQVRELHDILGDEVDGFFFDIVGVPLCYNKFSLALMEQHKLDPKKPTHRDQAGFLALEQFMSQTFNAARNGRDDVTVFFNGPSHQYAKNSRLFHMSQQYQTQVEIESLASGFWGYLNYPACVPYLVHEPMPKMGMTGVFHKMWGDFGSVKNQAAMDCEAMVNLGWGAACSIGDQLHPRGTLDQAKWDVLGTTYGRFKHYENHAYSAEPVTEIGVLAKRKNWNGFTPFEGVTRMFMETGVQFRVYDLDMDYSHLPLVILPDDVRFTQEDARKFDAYLAAGGKAIVTGTSGLIAPEDTRDTSNGFFNNLNEGELISPLPTKADVFAKGLGLKIAGVGAYQHAYFRVDSKWSKGHGDFAYYVPHRPLLVKPIGKTGYKTVLEMVAPYFDRSAEKYCGHCQTPADKPTGQFTGFISNQVAYFAYPLFTLYREDGNAIYKKLILQALQSLKFRPQVESNLPSTAYTVLSRKEAATLLTVSHWIPEKRYRTLDSIEEALPLYDCSFSVQIAKKPASVVSLSSGRKIRFTYAKGRVQFSADILDGFEMFKVQ